MDGEKAEYFSKHKKSYMVDVGRHEFHLCSTYRITVSFGALYKRHTAGPSFRNTWLVILRVFEKNELLQRLGKHWGGIVRRLLAATTARREPAPHGAQTM